MGTPKKVSVWWDGEGDFLEVTFDDEPGTMEPTEDKRVRAKINKQGEIVGFHIVGVSKTAKGKPFEVDLKVKEFEHSD